MLSPTHPAVRFRIPLHYNPIRSNPNSNKQPHRRCAMASDRQTAANRENSQKSTGPKTPEGRAAVRLNGLKHGLSAETIVVMGEDPADFDALYDSLLAEHQPATPTEEILVRQLAVAAWRQLRFFRMEAAFFKSAEYSHTYKRIYQ